ncbi:hypothetical protein FGO68_gene16937 [Halteria grandinella]|uniref:Protein kinase domain-containing protein n=1 Tax=Halteria grandinella TaxID=5974 RepID=A0A8J8NSR4_HALGN|nr:hypothetical protein FGO68_gene16937 [Halteria grandinella]
MEPLQQQLVIKQYRTIKKIRVGNFVTVYLAFDEIRHRVCTIKLQKTLNDEYRMCKSNQAFVEEISALTKAKHPFVIDMIESFLWEDENNKMRWCIVLEHADGGNLYDNYIQKKEKVNEKIALNWLAQISLALAHLCTAGLTNFDLSPRNIFLFYEKMSGTVKISGYGYLEEDNEIENPERYLAPEQIEGKNLQMKQTWAIGIIWYELLTGGEHPFETEFNGGYMSRLPRLDFRQNHAMSQVMKALLKLLLLKKPIERISINELLCHRLVKEKIVCFIEHCFVNEQDIEVLISQTKKLFQNIQPPQLEINNGQVEEEKQAQEQMVLPLSHQFEEAKLNELIQKMRQDGHGKLADIIQQDRLLIQRLRERHNLNHTVEWKPFEGVKERQGWADLLPGVYYGQCLKGIRDGYGLLLCSNGDNTSFLFECEWVNGFPSQGKVMLIYDNKWNKYEGKFDEKYLRTGIGIWNNEDGDKYQGQFKLAYRHGSGKYTFANGESYEGQQKNSNWHGNGTWTYSDGTYSVGKWKEDRRVCVHKFYSKDRVFVRQQDYGE